MKDFKSSAEELISELSYLVKQFDELNGKVQAAEWRKMAELVNHFDTKLQENINSRLSGQVEEIKNHGDAIVQQIAGYKNKTAELMEQTNKAIVEEIAKHTEEMNKRIADINAYSKDIYDEMSKARQIQATLKKSYFIQWSTGIACGLSFVGGILLMYFGPTLLAQMG